MIHSVLAHTQLITETYQYLVPVPVWYATINLLCPGTAFVLCESGSSYKITLNLSNIRKRYFLLNATLKLFYTKFIAFLKQIICFLNSYLSTN
jgi:hypothetical protein